ncbi:MAG: hypothetical protein PHD76_13675 [Methylacidiphilales bacterium]|nr:hypothetical protein [Candidatus Methylacidiphilales bacterium]
MPCSKLLCIHVTAVFFAFLCVGNLFSQQVAPVKVETPAINFQVLGSQRVKVGLHSVIYNQVAPPVFPAPAVQVQPAPTPQYQQWLQARQQKAFKFIMIGATVHDHQMTDLRWFDGDQWVRALSNFDFNYLTDTLEFESDNTIYEFFLITADMASDYLANDNHNQTLQWLAQARRQLPSNGIGYWIVDGNAVNNPATVAGLDDLHAYFNANKDQLVSDYQKRTADWERQERWNKAHPPVRQDTVINFWPVKSSVYKKSSNQ